MILADILCIILLFLNDNMNILVKFFSQHAYIKDSQQKIIMCDCRLWIDSSFQSFLLIVKSDLHAWPNLFSEHNRVVQGACIVLFILNRCITHSDINGTCDNLPHEISWEFFVNSQENLMGLVILRCANYQRSF